MRIAVIDIVLLRIASKMKTACRSQRDAPDGTASWQQVGVIGEHEPGAHGGSIIRRQGLTCECGGEHYRPTRARARSDRTRLGRRRTNERSSRVDMTEPRAIGRYLRRPFLR